MKKEHERVLAYKVAKEITGKQLNEISGGSASLGTKINRVLLTAPASGPDVRYETGLDW